MDKRTFVKHISYQPFIKTINFILVLFKKARLYGLFYFLGYSINLSADFPSLFSLSGTKNLYLL